MSVTSIGGKTGNISAVEVDGKSPTLAEDLFDALVEIGLVIDSGPRPKPPETASEPAVDYDPNED